MQVSILIYHISEYYQLDEVQCLHLDPRLSPTTSSAIHGPGYVNLTVSYWPLLYVAL